MFKDIAFVECTCDRCQRQAKMDDKSQAVENGWLIVDEQTFCPKCTSYYKAFRLEVGDSIICLINDPKRQLIKDELYEVCETPYNNPSSTVRDEDRENLAIYVSCGNGWQAKLINTQYDV